MNLQFWSSGRVFDWRYGFRRHHYIDSIENHRAGRDNQRSRAREEAENWVLGHFFFSSRAFLKEKKKSAKSISLSVNVRGKLGVCGFLQVF